MKRDVVLRGILPAMVTPMDTAGAIDEPALAALTDRLIRAGVGGLIPCGSTGEFTALSSAERRRVTEITVQAAAGRVPVVPHTGALTTHEAIELSQHAQSAGASAVMAIAPFYEPLPWPAIKAYYVELAASIDIPIMVYNLPGATGMSLSGEQLAELGSVDGVKWVKDSSGSGVALTELIQRYGMHINILNGWDTLTFYGLVAGTQASVWGAANFIPELAVELFDAAAVRQDLAAARAVWARIWPICNFLETSGSYVAAVKAACELEGIPCGDPRPPILPLEAAKRAELAEILASSTAAVTV